MSSLPSARREVLAVKAVHGEARTEPNGGGTTQGGGMSDTHYRSLGCNRSRDRPLPRTVCTGKQDPYQLHTKIVHLDHEGEIMPSLSYEDIQQACQPGGSSCLTSVTELAPAAGAHASIAPAKFAAPRKQQGVYAYEHRYIDGKLQTVVIIDSKQSQLNRVEAGIAQAIADDHPLLSRLPRLELVVVRPGNEQHFWDLELPHRAFDGHFRAGTINGRSAVLDPTYVSIRNATPANARPLLDNSPLSLVLGAWDATRASGQWRGRSVLTGEIIGVCFDEKTDMKGGARVDPLGMQIRLTPNDLKVLADLQQKELSPKLYKELVGTKADKRGDGRASASALGLGGIPPSLTSLAGVACERIIRSHVLSFAALRQLRFGGNPETDVACRALLAALALDGLARSDAELSLRANCDLVERSPSVVTMDRRWGEYDVLGPLGIDAADDLLKEALTKAETVAGVSWQGVTLSVQANPTIIEGSTEDEGDEGEQ
jgi:CRISPR-associated protein Csb1